MEDEDGMEAAEDKSVDSEWCTIGQRKTKKKKKKLRTVPWQDFFAPAQPANPTPDRRVTVEASDVLPDLNDDDEVMAMSMRHYFVDFLKRSGPTRVDSPRVEAEKAALADNNRRVLDKFPNLAAFLTQEAQIQCVDNILYLPEDLDKAKELALETILNNVNTRQKASTPLLRPVGSGTPPMEAGPVRRLSFGQEPSWLSPRASHGSPRPPGSPPLTPDTSIPPPPIQISAFGSIGGSPKGSIQEWMSKIDSLTQANIELQARLSQQEKHIEATAQLAGESEAIKAANGTLQRELEDKSKALAQLNEEMALMHKCVEGLTQEAPTKNSQATHLIIELQKQLNKERLNSHTLRTQLEIERRQAKNLATKNSVNSANLISGPTVGGGMDDLLGLRGLLLNTSSANASRIGGPLNTLPLSNGFISSTNGFGPLSPPAVSVIGQQPPRSPPLHMDQGGSLQQPNLSQQKLLHNLKEALQRDFHGITDPEIQAALQEFSASIRMRSSPPPGLDAMRAGVAEILSKRNPLRSMLN